MARPPAPVAALLAAVVAAGAILAGWASAPTLSELLCLIIATLMAGLAAWWGESSQKMAQNC